MNAVARPLAAVPVVLSPLQIATCEYLCAGGRSPLAPIEGATGATLTTLRSLTGLGLVITTSAGARGDLFHLTPAGRALYCATANDSEGGPTMTNVEIIDSEPTAATAEPEAVAAAPRARGQKDGELATTAAKAKGPSAEMTKLYKDVVKEIKAVAGRGAKGTEKLKYLRIGDAKGKTVAYVNFATSKSVLVEVPRVGATGYDTVSVKEEAHVKDAVAVVTAFVKARDEAAAAKAAAA